jgi:predicted enzyme related to lactoylglutathione lyase
MLRFETISIDARDPAAIATFWRDALGWVVTSGDDDDEVCLQPTDDSPFAGLVPDILFVRVPEEKVVKNRLHLDLRPDDQDLEVARLLALGAREVSVGQGEVTWVVLADPEGNEFCVLRSLTET